MSRPRIALVLTAWYPHSHADVLGRRLIEGYRWPAGVADAASSWVQPRVEVVSAYLDRPGSPDDERPEIGASVLGAAGVEVYGSVAEAMGVGRTGVNVDGVVVIGEHGAYGLSAFQQTLYPRRRLIESAVSTMLGAGRFVPLFNDKHLAWDIHDALALDALTRRLGIALQAGSSVPLAWRSGDLAWPAGEPMTSSVSIGYGAYDAYGAHLLELAQSYHEQRAGGETGVSTVETLTGERARQALRDGRVDRSLYEAALAVGGSSRPEAIATSADDLDPVIFLVTHRDGLRAAHVNHSQAERWSFAATGPTARVAVRAHLQPGAPFDHFTYLARQAENLMLTGVPSWPIERILLTNGILDAGMRSLHDGRGGEPSVRETPELALAYTAAGVIPDTGVGDLIPDWGERG